MKYLVYRIDQSSGVDDPFDEIEGMRLMIKDGVYIFYTTRPDEPDLAYPIDRFWLMKEV